jgi:AcrR family transcriptional regulator
MQSLMPTVTTTRAGVVAQIFNVFRDRGFEGATLSEISRATGLGKSSLYHYFPNGKDDMVVAIFTVLEQWMTDNVLGPLRGDGTPAQKLRAMVRAFDELYDGGRNACVLGALVSGGGRERFHLELKSSFALWIGALRDVAMEAGIPRREAQQRAEDAVVRFEGALIVSSGLGDPGPFTRAARHVERDLLAA